jgi:hypothetical protein
VFVSLFLIKITNPLWTGAFAAYSTSVYPKEALRLEFDESENSTLFNVDLARK